MSCIGTYVAHAQAQTCDKVRVSKCHGMDCVGTYAFILGAYFAHSDNVCVHQRVSGWSGLDACQVMSGANPVVMQMVLIGCLQNFCFQGCPPFFHVSSRVAPLQRSPVRFEGPFQGHPFEAQVPSKVPLNLKFQLKVSSKVCRSGGVR